MGCPRNLIETKIDVICTPWNQLMSAYNHHDYVRLCSLNYHKNAWIFKQTELVGVAFKKTNQVVVMQLF